MTKRLIIFALAFIMLSASTYAADLNAGMTAEELQTMLAELKASSQAAQAAATTQLVTIRMDTETQQLFQQLEDKMMSIEQKLGIFEERFLTLKNDLTDKIDATSAANIIAIQEKVIAEMRVQHNETQQYTRDMTNPIRINLPNFALWLMVTAAFMLGAGLKMQKRVNDAKRELKDIEDGVKHA